MALEEKVKEASDKWQSRYYESNYTLDDNAKFAAGAKWLLCELKPVMDEMKEALETVAEFHMNLAHTTDINHHAKRALAKYNELFKK